MPGIKPKNVLFIVIDQMRADCLRGPLAEAVDLPHLRALQADAVSFARHYSVTSPCGPSRASILTGQYAMNHRSVRNGTPLRATIPTLPSELRRAGHLPLLYGYTDTSQDPAAYTGKDRALTSYEQPMAGFHEVVEMRQLMSYPWRADLIAKGYAFDNYLDVYRPQAPAGRAARPDDPALYRAEDSDTAFLTNACLTDLAARAGQGWIAHLTYIRPHPPLVAPEPYNRMVDPATLPLPRRLPDAAAEAALHPFFGPALHDTTPVDMVAGFPDLGADDDTIQMLRAIYLGLAAEVDHHIGRVVHFLKDSGQYDNTLLILTADHGEMLGDRHAWGKMSVYDAAYHTPLIIRAPGAQAARGTTVHVPTESIDIAPTILDALGLDVPPSMDGRSLGPFLQGEQPDGWRDYSYSELDFADPLRPTAWQKALGCDTQDSNLAILREDRFTLVQFACDLAPMLFDHDEAGEMQDLAANPEYADTLMRLTARMLRHRMRHSDQTHGQTLITAAGPRTARPQR